MTNETYRGLQVRSRVTAAGQLQLTLEEDSVSDPGPDEVIVRVEAAPLNPSDLVLVLGPADLATMQLSTASQTVRLTADVPPARMPSLKARIDQSLAVGNEGAGTVIAVGSNVQHLLGKRVGMLGGAMYSQYRKVPAHDCIVLPDDATAAEGASMFINPLTALSMVDVMRRENHSALIHTAAASNLGQMLTRICLADGVELVNIVRSPAQAELLRAIGATHVVDSSADDFKETLTDAVAATGATLCFDAIGGGWTANAVLHAMENAAKRSATSYAQYGTKTFKQVYIYGGLDTGPIQLDRGFGLTWSVSGFLVMNYLEKIGWDATLAMRERVARELWTTFASNYTRTISLAELLQPDIIAGYAMRATGEKYLLDPTRT